MTLYDLLQFEIKHGTQRSVGVLYAVCFLTMDVDPSDDLYRARCKEANTAIIARWSFAALDRVKAIAWKIAELNAVKIAA